MAEYRGTKRVTAVYQGLKKIHDYNPVISILSGDGGVGTVIESTFPAQWFADGAPIRGERARTYVVTAQTVGAVISQRGSNDLAAAIAPLVIDAIQPISETVQDGGALEFIIPVSGGTAPYIYAATGPVTIKLDGDGSQIPVGIVDLSATFDDTITVTVTDSGDPVQTETASVPVTIAAAVAPAVISVLTSPSIATLTEGQTLADRTTQGAYDVDTGNITVETTWRDDAGGALDGATALVAGGVAIAVDTVTASDGTVLVEESAPVTVQAAVDTTFTFVDGALEIQNPNPDPTTPYALTVDIDGTTLNLAWTSGDVPDVDGQGFLLSDPVIERAAGAGDVAEGDTVNVTIPAVPLYDSDQFGAPTVTTEWYDDGGVINGLTGTSITIPAGVVGTLYAVQDGGVNTRSSNALTVATVAAGFAFGAVPSSVFSFGSSRRTATHPADLTGAQVGDSLIAVLGDDAQSNGQVNGGSSGEEIIYGDFGATSSRATLVDIPIESLPDAANSTVLQTLTFDNADFTFSGHWVRDGQVTQSFTNRLGAGGDVTVPITSAENFVVIAIQGREDAPTAPTGFAPYRTASDGAEYAHITERVNAPVGNLVIPAPTAAVNGTYVIYLVEPV